MFIITHPSSLLGKRKRSCNDLQPRITIRKLHGIGQPPTKRLKPSKKVRFHPHITYHLIPPRPSPSPLPAPSSGKRIRSDIFLYSELQPTRKKLKRFRSPLPILSSNSFSFCRSCFLLLELFFVGSLICGNKFQLNRCEHSAR